MTLVELFEKYYLGEITDKEEILKIYKKDIDGHLFNTITTNEGEYDEETIYSMGTGNTIGAFLGSVYCTPENYEDFIYKSKEFMEILFPEKISLAEAQNMRKEDKKMTLVELFEKYYTGEITAREEILKIYNRDINGNLFGVIKDGPDDEEPIYSIGNGNTIGEIQNSIYCKMDKEKFFDKEEEFLNIIFPKKKEDCEKTINITMVDDWELFYRDYKTDESEYEVVREYEVVMDEELNVTVIPETPVKEIYYKSGGLYQVTANEYQGYMDDKGKIVIPCIYEVGYPFSDSGLAFVITKDSRKGYINKENEMVIILPEETEYGGVFEHGLAHIIAGDSYYFINEAGERAFNEDFLFTDGFAENGLAIVKDKNNIFKAIDTKGNIVFRLPEFISAEGFHKSPEVAKIKHGKSSGLVDKNGNIILGCNFDEIMISSNSNFHMAKYKERWALIGEKGKVLTDYIFKDPTYVNKEGYFATQIDADSDMADELLKIADEFYEFPEDAVLICKAGRYGFTCESVHFDIRSYEISEESPLITFCNYDGVYSVENLNKREPNKRTFKSFLSRHYKGETIGYLSGDEILELMKSK